MNEITYPKSLCYIRGKVGILESNAGIKPSLAPD